MLFLQLNIFPRGRKRARNILMWCAALLFHVFPAMAADISCVRPPAPAIAVHISEDPTIFDLDKNMDDLALFRNAANSGHLPSRYHGDVGGVTEGLFKANYDVSFHQGESAGFDNINCVSIKAIDVYLELEPTVYIASEFKDNACWFREIFGHETNHVETDRQVANGHIKKIEDALAFAFQRPEDYTYIEVPDGKIHVAMRDLKSSVKGAIGEMFGSMLRERMNAQLKLDNPAEYTRIAQACPSIKQEQLIPTSLP